MITTLLIIGVLGISLFLFLQHPQFGKKPSGERLQRLKKSPQFKNGRFENSHFTPDIAEGYSMIEVLWEFLFKKVERISPTDTIPSVKTDLNQKEANPFPLITPMIGELVELKNEKQQFQHWWKEVK